MRYIPPTGSTDPNAPYVGKNPAIGQQGSKVPPAAIEHTMREIVAVIVGAGLIPNESNLGQLWEAIQATIASGGTPDIGSFKVVTSAPSPSPPLSPASGDEVLVAENPTGAFAGHALQLARFNGSSWVFSAIRIGRCFRINGTDTYYSLTSGGWAAWTLPMSAVDGLVASLANKSDVGHIHAYLPLAGGALTGPLTGTTITTTGSHRANVGDNGDAFQVGSSVAGALVASLCPINLGSSKYGLGVYGTASGGDGVAGWRVVFDNKGYAGFGTTSPAEKLDIVGNVALSGALKLAAGFGANNQVAVSKAGAANQWANVIDLLSASELRAKIGGQTVWAAVNCWGAKPANGTTPANLRVRGCTVTTNEFSSGYPVMVVTFSAPAPDTSYVVMPDNGAVSAKTVNGFTFALGNLSTSVVDIDVYL